MCEHVQELVSESIRKQAGFPADVEEHLHSCDACSQYVALCSLVSIAGRPPIQLPPTDLSNRIAESTFEKRTFWDGLFEKPALWVPAAGLVACAGWLLASPRTITSSVKPDQVAIMPAARKVSSGSVPTINTPSNALAEANQASLITRDRAPVLPAKKLTDRPSNVRLAVKRVPETMLDNTTETLTSPVSVPVNTSHVSSTVSGHFVELAQTVVSRVPNITEGSAPVVVVQAPNTAKSLSGRAALVLASADEETERDDLRASFQSQLNQQSESFRTTNAQAIQYGADSNRINVVNAPVATGGK